MQFFKKMKLNSLKAYIRFKLLFKNMSRRARALFLAGLLLPVLLLSFQNCGQKFSSNLSTESSLTEGQQSNIFTPSTGRCAAQLNKCVVGIFIDAVDTTTENKWLCQGLNSGSTVSCSLRITSATPLPPPTASLVNGQCSSVLNQCYSGIFSDSSDTVTENKWSCLGSGGGTSAACSTTKPPVVPTPTPTPNPVPVVVHGACSTNLNQCTTGQFRDDADTSTQQKWSCLGSNGGSAMACAIAIIPAPTPINGSCSSTLNQCAVGGFLDLVDTDFQYQWSCLGSNGGAAVTCSSVRPPTSPPPLPSVAAPSGTTLYNFAHDLEYSGVNGPVKFDFYHPKDFLTKQNLPVFIWVHGGGWSGGDKADDRELAQKIAERGFIVLNVNYTLAPAVSASIYPTPYIAPNPYTMGVRDILAAVDLVKLKAPDFHIDVQKISIGGGSAGGHLSLMTAASGATTFNCVISAAGPTDLVLATQQAQFPATVWIAKSIYGDNLSVLKTHSPLYQVNNIQARRVYLLHQEKDNLVPIDHARNFTNAARSRFQGALEYTFLNDPLPAGTPYEYSPPEKLTHNFDTPQVINAVGNFLSNKCY